MITAIGVTLFFVGFAGTIAAMLLGTTKEGIWSAPFRGAFQEAKDYSPLGWRCYKVSFSCAAVGFVLAAIGVFLPQ